VGNPRVLRQLPRGLRRLAKRSGPNAPDLEEMTEAISAFLAAAGVDLKNPNLKGTPARVSQAWADELLDGYRTTPEEALGETFAAPRTSDGELVVVTDLRFHSTCPHHLMPYQGRAHLAYVPSERVVGFGRLSSLLDCFAHRLILQEDLAREVARALAKVMGSPATACIIQAEQACLRLRGDHQRDAVTHSEAYEGLLRKNLSLRAELWARIGKKK
jgi:GTP cyclohydrolase IA